MANWFETITMTLADKQPKRERTMAKKRRRSLWFLSSLLPLLLTHVLFISTASASVTPIHSFFSVLAKIRITHVTPHIYQVILGVHRIIPTFRGTITEYPIPTSGSYPVDITNGPNQTLWFTENNANQIGMLTPNGMFTEYHLNNSAESTSQPWGITVGPDGNIWFTERGTNNIGRITSSGTITEYQIPTMNSVPFGITTGPDGNIWFTEEGSGKIGKLTLGGTFTEYPLPIGISYPWGITTGPDGNIWFTEYNTGKIGKITTSGMLTEYTTPTPNSEPIGIAASPKSSTLWFTESQASKIATINSKTGTITEYPTPTSHSGPYGIAQGADGRFWFTEFLNNSIGRVGVQKMTEYPVPGGGSYERGITSGPNNDLWFTGPFLNIIGSITTS